MFKMTFVDFIQVREYIIIIIIWHMKLIYLYIKALKFSELKSMLGQSSLGPLVGLRPASSYYWDPCCEVYRKITKL